ncbi:Cyclin d3 [Quillaja saponaria]|uniref:B-like cyclin n=1 Tax=Quillaja saponaria TaxID=32244 RepID=A0AAD7LYN5_QUISA|nr:Cyclin d3 [Quillaja saponaria]
MVYKCCTNYSHYKKMAHRYQQESDAEKRNPSFLLDALYCREEHWKEDDVSDEYFFHQEFDQVDEEESYSSNKNKIKLVPVLLEQDLYWEDEELNSLLSKQQPNELTNKLETNPCLAESRREAVEWMLKVIAHYSFFPLTAVLAVNYIDRFLFSFPFESEKPWMTQLAAVACLSLAAKVEETQVPHLLDLQVEESKYVFEAKTIKRMEILVLSTLKWKMNPVTPISFLDYITRRIGLKDYLCWEFLKRCQTILLCVILDSRFMCYLPSTIAAATLLHVISSIEPSLGVEYQCQLLGILRIEKDKVDDCCRLILKLASGCHGKQSNKRKFIGSITSSPNGVMDVSFSSDSSNDSWAVASSVSSSPEPLPKKSRAQQRPASADPSNS